MTEIETSHATTNRSYWDDRADWYVTPADQNWAATEPTWGLWGIPQSQLPVLPTGLAGLDTVELGCGTGYVSAWLARAGARPVGVDNSPKQLATARAMQERYQLRFPLILADAEAVPLADAGFDLAISEYGASIWCDPYRWIPEAARLLRPGGRLIFMRNATLLMLCEPAEGPATGQLQRDQFGLCRLEWTSPEGAAVEFQLPHGDLIRLLRASGFIVDDLIEVQAPKNGTTSYEYVTLGWARRWPAEEVWFATKHH